MLVLIALLYTARSDAEVVGRAMVLEKNPVPGRPTYLIRSTALAVGAGGGCLEIFFCHLPYLLKTAIMSGRAVEPKTTNQIDRMQIAEVIQKRTRAPLSGAI